MEIRRVYIDDIINNEKNIKNYLEDLISETTKVDVKERIKEIYDRMKVFLSDNSAIIYGGFDNDAMIGFIWAYEINSMVYHINYFYISKAYRKRGIGTELLKQIEKECKARHGKEIELWVKNDNYSAIEFYQKNNFAESSIKMKKILKIN